MSAAAGAGLIGPPVLTATLRASPEDFCVDEVLGFDAAGEGEHLMLRIEKRGANTAWVAQQLARWAGIAEHAVGYAGLKDRHAVTRQSFTLHLPHRRLPDIASVQLDGVRVLAHAWHRRKLPRGALAGNRFELLLRDVQGVPVQIERRLQQLATAGFPNAFGAQRFGHGGGNVARAEAMFGGARVRRSERGMLLSAARSELFNAVLAQRCADGSWSGGMDGEVWMLDGRGSHFGPEPANAALAARAAALEIHPTGPLWGRGEPPCAGAVRALEAAVAATMPVLAGGLEDAGLRQERRALRASAGGLAWSFPASDQLQLSVFLQRGSYATALLAALGTVVDAQGAGAAAAE